MNTLCGLSLVLLVALVWTLAGCASTDENAGEVRRQAKELLDDYQAEYEVRWEEWTRTEGEAAVTGRRLTVIMPGS